MATLEEGRIYAIDGGLFQATYVEEEDRFELWTYEGMSGRVIARTGFNIDPDGQLYHRVFDFETREQIQIVAEGYTVADLEQVNEDELS